MAQQVNIYIETSCKGPRAQKAAGAWIVECVRKQGKPAIRGGILYADKVAENELALNLVRSAFDILTRPCQCRVFTECKHILGAMQNGWMWQWKSNNWITAKGTMAKHAEAWNQCAGVMEQHTTEWVKGPHDYRIRMQRRIIEELSVEHELPESGIFVIIPVPEWNTQ